VMLMDAIKPNLMQTLEGTPALVHTGPFGNIATGNSSIVADRIGIHTGDFLLTEAGFGADMGAERFFNIKCRASGIAPDAAVLVATVRGLKAHSGNHRIVAGKTLPPEILAENPDEVHAGGANLRKQIENMAVHGVTPVVAVNVFPEDHPGDIAAVGEIAEELGARWAVTTHFADGGRGAARLAEAIVEAASEESSFKVLYPDEAPLRDKIHAVATKVYGADGVDYSERAAAELDTYEAAGFGHLPVCIAKTQYSLSDNPKLPGAPRGWALTVTDASLSAGAGFVVVVAGDMMLMPGLGKSPQAHRLDLDAEGNVVGMM
jgi:formate--tetrahydrofolate ligase